MDRGLSLFFMLMAGVLPLMALRERLAPRTFRLLAIVYAAVAAAALVAWFTVGPARPPIPQDVPFERV